MLTKSIRWRFQLWLAFLLVCILSGFGVTAHRLHRNVRFEQIDAELTRRQNALSVDVRPRPGPGGPGERLMHPFDELSGTRPPIPLERDRPEPHGRHGFPDGPPISFREIRLSATTAALFDADGGDGYYYAVWNRGTRLLSSSSNSPPELAIPARESAGTTRHVREWHGNRESYQFNQLGECYLVGKSLQADLASINRFRWWLLAAGVLILAVGMGGGWWLVDSAIQPVQQMITAASRISAGNLSERIKEEDPESEFGRLVSVLNQTFSRLESAFSQQKQFTADVAHELRTPIAVLISEAQTILARERTAPEYRETVEACLATAQQMRRLTESLLELARFESGQTLLEVRSSDLAEVVSKCVRMLEPLASAKRVKIETILAPAPCRCDPQRIEQVITNLLVNAINYNVEKGRICARTWVDEDHACVEVSDTGIGISPSDIPHLFKRFFRADSSRNRSEGHAGIGLAIVQAIIDRHGGTIEVTSEPSKGSTFRVRLPLAE